MRTWRNQLLRRLGRPHGSAPRLPEQLSLRAAPKWPVATRFPHNDGGERRVRDVVMPDLAQNSLACSATIGGCSSRRSTLGSRLVLVFPSVTGGLRRPKSITKPFDAALAAAGIKRRQTIHGLRRTFNDLLCQVASGEVVRSMTGHSTQQMTEHYSHIANSEKAGAVVRAFGDLAGGDAGGDHHDEGAGACAPTPLTAP